MERDTRRCPMNDSQAVGIIGMGAVTSYGWGLQKLWDGLVSGKSAAEPIEFDDISGQAVMVPDGGEQQDSITLSGRAMYGSGRARPWPTPWRGGGGRATVSVSSCVRPWERSRAGATCTSSTPGASAVAISCNCSLRRLRRCSWPKTASRGRPSMSGRPALPARSASSSPANGSPPDSPPTWW